MNPPRVYMCSPSRTLLPPPSPYHPSGPSQCTSPKHPALCIEPGLATRFLFFPLHPFRVNLQDRQFSLPLLGGGGKAVDSFVVHPDTKGVVFWGPSFKQWWLSLDIDFSLCVHLNQYIHSFGKRPQAKDSLGLAYFLDSYLHSILGLQVCVCVCVCVYFAASIECISKD